MCASPAPTTTRCLTTSAATPPRNLIDALPTPTGSVCFVQDGDGLVGWGAYASTTVVGPDAADRIAQWYADQVSRLHVIDEVGTAGSGPVCFVSLGFSPRDPSVAVIPMTLLGRRGTDQFMTTISGDPELPRPEPVRGPGQVRYHDAALSVATFTSAVAAAVARIRAGEAAKVVLSHGLQAETEEPVDTRYLLARLAERYPSCVAFDVGGLVGASPETLMTRRGRTISSRVLAGTAWPEHSLGAVEANSEVAAHLLASAKDLQEHRLAVQSVADTLGPLATRLDVPAAPSALALANLTHLATDISGELAAEHAGLSALELAARLHPTAAVGGAPSEVAQAMISELEPDLRGRYAAPVGWIDTRGDGDFAIALRCAQVDGRSVRLMAGGGIMADSDPENEAQEAQIKMIPVRDALEG